MGSESPKLITYKLNRQCFFVQKAKILFGFGERYHKYALWIKENSPSTAAKKKLRKASFQTKTSQEILVYPKSISKRLFWIFQVFHPDNECISANSTGVWDSEFVYRLLVGKVKR